MPQTISRETLYDQLLGGTVYFGKVGAENEWRFFPRGSKAIPVEGYSENFGSGLVLETELARISSPGYPRREDFKRVVETCARALAVSNDVPPEEFLPYVAEQMKF